MKPPQLLRHIKCTHEETNGIERKRTESNRIEFNVPSIFGIDISMQYICNVIQRQRQQPPPNHTEGVSRPEHIRLTKPTRRIHEGLPKD